MPQRILHQPGGPGSQAGLALPLPRPLTCGLSAGPGLPALSSQGLVDTDLFFCVPEMTSGLQHRALSSRRYNSSHPLHPQGERKALFLEQAWAGSVDKGGICSRLT